MSDLENETTSDTATFEHFGRSWTVPTRKHHKHIRAAKTIQRREGFLDADDIAEIYLSVDEYEALLELDKPADELSAFAGKIAEALGVGDSGNSEPSSTSS